MKRPYEQLVGFTCATFFFCFSNCFLWKSSILIIFVYFIQKKFLETKCIPKVVSTSISRLVAHPSIFRLLMKGKLDAYVLWPLAKRVELNSRMVYCSWLYDNLVQSNLVVRNFLVTLKLFLNIKVSLSL